MSTEDYLHQQHPDDPQVWTADRAKAYRDVFYEFLEYCTIPSKEKGNIKLGGQLYPAQERGLDMIFDGLQAGIHDFKWLKGRQQGISTICRPFTSMWIAMHEGTRGAFVLDTAQHMAEARTEVEYTLQNLPARLRFPQFNSNRYGGKFANGSTVTFLAAGVRKSEAGAALGRGQGLSVVHASEIGTFGNPEGTSSFLKSLAEENPSRLYIWESTGRNVGSIWHQMWTTAQANDLEEKCIFTGWYLVPTHRIRRGTRLFERFGDPEITREEQKRIDEVRDRYGWEITREQLAWYRKESNPGAYGGDDLSGDGRPEEGGDISGDEYQGREHPWTVEEGFTVDGSNFFNAEKLTTISKTTVSDDFKAYRFYTGTDFLMMAVEPARSRRDAQLRVWQEPKPEGVYVIGADPAYGANEKNDRSCAQVMRCYADRLEQVAEFASPLTQPHQFAWVLLSLLGWYRNARLILEINGPGSAVWQEVLTTKKNITHGYMRREAEQQGLANIWGNVRSYIYSRPDAMTPGMGSLHWKTSPSSKEPMLERMNDFLTNGTLIMRSRELVEEARAMTRKDGSIEAEGSEHDDRIIAIAISIIAWERHERQAMSMSGRTRDAEIARASLSLADQFELLSKHHLTTFFKSKERSRREARDTLRKLSWRGF